MLANDKLTAIYIDAYEYYDLTLDDLWTIDNYRPNAINHANTIVGYNDSFGPYTENGKTRYGAFKIANSWGKGFWGDHNYDGCYWISYECMKKRISYCTYYIDRIDYKPKLLSVFKINHNFRGDCEITIGKGDKTNPDAKKEMKDIWPEVSFPFPSSKIVYDITEFCNTKPGIDGSNFFLKVYDKNSKETGKIKHFSIEYYDRYPSEKCNATSYSIDPPKSTEKNKNVFVETVLDLNNSNNPPNRAVYEKPDNDATSVPIDTKLSCYIDDPNDDNLDVTFYWKQNSDTEYNLINGSRGEINPGPLDPDTTYWWYVSVSDGEYSREAGPWRFLTTSINTPPNKPSTPKGPLNCKMNVDYTFNVSTTDLNGDNISYLWILKNTNYGYADWYKIGPYDSGYEMDFIYNFDRPGTYDITVIPYDEWGNAGTISDPLTITVTKSKTVNFPLYKFFENHPIIRLLFQRFSQFF
jgi:hypothetical protein